MCLSISSHVFVVTESNILNLFQDSYSNKINISGELGVYQGEEGSLEALDELELFRPYVKKDYFFRDSNKLLSFYITDNSHYAVVECLASGKKIKLLDLKLIINYFGDKI